MKKQNSPLQTSRGLFARTSKAVLNFLLLLSQSEELFH